MWIIETSLLCIFVFHNKKFPSFCLIGTIIKDAAEKRSYGAWMNMQEKKLKMAVGWMKTINRYYVIIIITIFWNNISCYPFCASYIKASFCFSWLRRPAFVLTYLFFAIFSSRLSATLSTSLLHALLFTVHYLTTSWMSCRDLNFLLSLVIW